MDHLFTFPLSELPFVFLVIVIAFTLHEFAHAYVADKFGDPTPRSMGRITLNPRSHIDVLGIILIFLVGFGWARPVMIRPSFFKKPRLMNVLVSLAGPAANLFLVVIGVLLAHLAYQLKLEETLSFGAFRAVAVFIRQLIQLNLILFVFNLLPLPPLDGYRILHQFMPYRIQVRMQGYEQWAFFIFLLIVFIDPLYNATLLPLFHSMFHVLTGIDYVFRLIFGNHDQLYRIFFG